jgi:transcriptional regulator with XRE-family HTH domain
MPRLKVKEIAEAKGVNMSQLSRRADLAYRTISQLWHNPGHDASLSTLAKIAKVLDVSIHDLISEEEDEEPPTAQESEGGDAQ